MSENEEIEYFNLGNREKVNSINKNNEKNIKVYQEIFENIINNLNKEYDINIENCKLENLKINSLNCLKTNLKNTIELIIKNKYEKKVLFSFSNNKNFLLLYKLDLFTTTFLIIII